MKTKEIIALLPQLKSIKRKKKDIDRQIFKLTKESKKLGETIYRLDLISEVYEGEPLEYFSYAIGDQQWVRPDKKRSARIYRNAHHPDKNLYGAYLNKKMDYGWKEIWLGADWKNKKELTKICKDWVAKGVMPKGNFK